MLGVELHLYMQGGQYNTYSMDLGPTENTVEGGGGGEKEFTTIKFMSPLSLIY